MASAQTAGGNQHKAKSSGAPAILPDQLATVAQRAAESGASERTQRMADKVAKADPELAREVAHGEKTLPQAVEELTGKRPGAKPWVEVPAVAHEPEAAVSSHEAAQVESDSTPKPAEVESDSTHAVDPLAFRVAELEQIGAELLSDFDGWSGRTIAKHVGGNPTTDSARRPLLPNLVSGGATERAYTTKNPGAKDFASIAQSLLSNARSDAGDVPIVYGADLLTPWRVRRTGRRLRRLEILRSRRRPAILPVCKPWLAFRRVRRLRTHEAQGQPGNRPGNISG